MFKSILLSSALISSIVIPSITLQNFENRDVEVTRSKVKDEQYALWENFENKNEGNNIDKIFPMIRWCRSQFRN